MKNEVGSNSQDIKEKNRGIVLRLICTQGPISRGEVAKKTGLTKMTATNIIGEMLEDGMVKEEKSPLPPTAAGRIPYLIDIAATSPLVCGVSIDRSDCEVLLFDYKANIIARKKEKYGIPQRGESLTALIVKLFRELKSLTDRPITAMGVAAPGPLSTVSGTILNPPNFHGIRDFPIAKILAEKTGLPCVLINDARAGALAERIYGKGKNLENFIYLQFHQGIGAGLVANGNLAGGSLGLAGEIGHTSINFSGPVCPCGNIGCLELYANAEQVEQRAAEMLKIGKKSGMKSRKPQWAEIIEAANLGDCVATAALEPFCEYVSVALINYLNLTDCHTVLLGYAGNGRDGFIERQLEHRVNSRLLASEYRHVEIHHSFFGKEAPIIGSAAVAADLIFSGDLSMYGRKDASR